MLEPLIKVSQFGKLYEVIRFQKPLIRSTPSRIFRRRSKGVNTFKVAQSLWRTKRRIRRFVSVMTEHMGEPAFATFTYTEPQMDMNKAIEDWRLFTRRMKRKYPTVAFLRVPERHKSGAVHFHAVMFGLPYNQACVMKKMRHRWIHACGAHRYCERKSRALAQCWGRGFVDVQKVRSPESIGAYVAKYLTKGDPDWSLFGNHIASCNDVFYKKINSARQAGIFWEITSYNSPVAVDHALEILQSRAQLRMYREFETKWLGSARFEVWEAHGG